MTSPLRLTSPLVGLSCPVSRLNSVVLPAPLGPMMLTISPRPSSTETSLTAVRPPKRFTTLCAFRNGALIDGPPRSHQCNVRCPPSGRNSRLGTARRRSSLAPVAPVLAQAVDRAGHTAPHEQRGEK